MLVTRPAREAAALAAQLAAEGYAPVLAPMLEIVPRRGVRLGAAKEVQALLVTSGNGVRGLAAAARSLRWRTLPVLAVGDATARLARAAGFRRAESAAGDARALAALAARRLDPEAGPLLLASGAGSGLDLARALRARGFRVRRRVVYQSRPARALPAPARAALAAGAIAAVPLFSPRTARAFARLLRRAGLAATVTGAAALCLSAAVARAARGLPWRRVAVAARPEMPALMALLRTLAPAS